MRQIPSEGEYCGNCLCRNANVCLLYVEQLSFDIQALRDTQCLRDKPQVLTEEERLNIQAVGYKLGRNEALIITEKPLSKWKVDPSYLP